MPPKKPGLDSFVVAVDGESPSRESTRTSALAAMNAFLSWCSRNGEAAAAGTGSPGGGEAPAPSPFLDDGESDDDGEEEEGGEVAPSGPASWGYPPTFADMTTEQVCRVVLWQRFYYYLRHKARWGWRSTAKDKEYKFSVICDYARTVMLHARKMFVGDDLCNPKNVAARQFFAVLDYSAKDGNGPVTWVKQIELNIERGMLETKVAKGERPILATGAPPLYVLHWP